MLNPQHSDELAGTFLILHFPLAIAFCVL